MTLRLIVQLLVNTRNKPSDFGAALVGAVIVVWGKRGIPMIYDTFTLNSPSFSSTTAFRIMETSAVNFKATSKIKLPHLLTVKLRNETKTYTTSLELKKKKKTKSSIRQDFNHTVVT